MSGTRGKVVHLSSAHRADDVRIFYKECRSLAAAGYDVTLIARAERDETINGVKIHAVKGESGNRFRRMTATVMDVYRKAREADGDIYHFHDPELIPVGMLLQLRGKRVIYDVHEHVADQMLTKAWLPKSIRRPLSRVYRLLERVAVQRVLSGIVVSDPSHLPDYPQGKTVVVENFPILDEAPPSTRIPYDQRQYRIAYIGGISESRGVAEMVTAIDLVNTEIEASLALAGKFIPQKLEEKLRLVSGWRHVESLGFLDRHAIYELLEQSRIGIVVLHPIPNYLNSQPVKLLEYMMAGLPVVVCDFPYYRQYVKDANCGIMVDPLDPTEIAAAVSWLLAHPEEAQQMGARGRQAVISNYSWHSQAAKLLGLYQKLAPISR